MTKQYSIAEARNHFTMLVRDVEQESAIQLTRRGKPVAVLLSINEYNRLSTPHINFWEAYTAFKQQVDLKQAQVASDIFANVRPTSPGREVGW